MSAIKRARVSTVGPQSPRWKGAGTNQQRYLWALWLGLLARRAKADGDLERMGRLNAAMRSFAAWCGWGVV
jgi:hypothetical protein